MANIADKSAIRKYDVNTVYYRVTRRPLGEKRYSDVFTTWRCIDKTVTELSGCRRDKYKFVLVPEIPQWDECVKDCVIYTCGGYNDASFLSFDELAEIVMNTKSQRDNDKWRGG
jgi:hypothetical protein